ncbi:MAG: bifunctional glutamate N-acetyltransferase/amino-acid acetyltransferase ArgJ [Clostridiales bacterium]
MFHNIAGGVTSAKGYVAAAVHAGIKSRNADKLDLAVVISQQPAAAAGVFTQNKYAAAPVKWCRQVQQGGKAQAFIVNSGIANAVTSQQGMKQAAAMAEIAAKMAGCAPEQIFVCSTGVIGPQIPMDKVAAGAQQMTDKLSPEGGHRAALAIMTTDTVAKEAALTFSLGGKLITIGGMAKGSGMIMPNMATMLAFLTTDAAITPQLLQQALQQATAKSFNMICVDGDTSTNDSYVALANGMAGNPLIAAENEDYQVFAAAVAELSLILAKKMAADGEGATHLLEVRVTGAKSYGDAAAIAKAVTASSLVKTAFFGEDANWGRIACAAGYSGADFDPEQVNITLSSRVGAEPVMAKGAGLLFDEAKAAAILHEKEILISLELGDGDAAATAWGCDLSYDYVKINGDYRS